MRFDANRIVVLRHTAMIAMRCVCVVFLVIGTIQFSFAIAWAAATADFQNLFIMWNDGWAPFAWGVAITIPAVLMLVLDRRIVRWIIPMPRLECPECGYAFRGLSSPQCPECGFRLEGQEGQQN